MDVKQLRSLKPELDGFLERYLSCFGREENHTHASTFVQGLLAKGERRNVENIAEGMEGGVVRTLQKFISQAAWDDRAVLDELRAHVKQVLGDDAAIVNVDETGFPKKGTKSVGVKRQYAGTLGRTDNCQVGVFLNYCSASSKGCGPWGNGTFSTPPPMHTCGCKHPACVFLKGQPVTRGARPWKSRSRWPRS